MSEPHILTVVAEVPHVVDDYGTEVQEAEVHYRLECPGVTEECRGLIDCGCTHPDDDERFEGADDDPALREVYHAALSAYEDLHPEYGWELSDDCWALSAIYDWEPDEPWEPGRYEVRVKADHSWGGPEDAALVLIRTEGRTRSGMSRLSNRDVDAIVQMQYEDALADEEPWAVEAYEYRKVVKSAVTADAGCLAGFSGESPQPISDHHAGRLGAEDD